MSNTGNPATDVDAEYRTVRWDVRRPMPEYISVTINVAEMARRKTISRLNRWLRAADSGEPPTHE